MKRLEDKVAIVTGSSSGIGKAIALRFGEEGAKVVVAARRKSLCEEVARTICQKGGDAFVIQTDVSHEQQVDALFEKTIQQYGRVDIVVNNAGIFGGRRIAETTTKAFDDVMSVNLRGTFFCCRAAFKHMKKQGGGVILNMSSVAGVQAWAGTGAYSASKHGVMALSRSLAEEGRPFGIRVSAICPGGVANDLVDASQKEILRSEKISPFDIAETAIYLATLGKYAVVHQIVVDRWAADW
ncbi:MAG TPA: SDR family oxidoreductase [Nitrospira sp.]|nr:SDR family oxidoreductase [Nitrospira sp.]